MPVHMSRAEAEHAGILPPKPAPSAPPSSSSPAPRRRDPAPRRARHVGVVAAEYFACVALLAIAPLVPTGDGPVPKKLIEPFARFTAISAVFIVLGVLSGRRSTAGVAAAFGGLVTVGVAFNARDSIAGIGRLLAGQKADDIHVKQGPPLAPPPGVAPVAPWTGPNANASSYQTGEDA